MHEHNCGWDTKEANLQKHMVRWCLLEGVEEAWSKGNKMQLGGRHSEDLSDSMAPKVFNVFLYTGDSKRIYFECYYQ